MKVAIIGCGLIGQKRAKTLGRGQLVACADLLPEKAETLAKQYPQCRAYKDYSEMLACEDLDIVIVATLHSSLAKIAQAAVQTGKHTLIEKPAARRRLNWILSIAAAKSDRRLRTRRF